MIRQHHYRGSVARTYEARRAGPLWNAEQKAVERAIRSWDKGATVLDVPVGTGRFLPLYDKYGLRAVGVDVSPDMLHEAKKKGARASLHQASIYNLPFSDASFDHAVCFRILNWMALDEVQQALAEVRRVTACTLLLGATLQGKGEGVHMTQTVHSEGGFYRALRDAGWRRTDASRIYQIKGHGYWVVSAGVVGS